MTAFPGRLVRGQHQFEIQPRKGLSVPRWRRGRTPVFRAVDLFVGRFRDDCAVAVDEEGFFERSWAEIFGRFATGGRSLSDGRLSCTGSRHSPECASGCGRSRPRRSAVVEPVGGRRAHQQGSSHPKGDRSTAGQAAGPAPAARVRSAASATCGAMSAVSRSATLRCVGPLML